MYYTQLTKLNNVQFTSCGKFNISSLDSEYVIETSKKCRCSIQLSYRDIIDSALKPAIQNITSIVSAALVNPNLFGRYTVPNLFTIGNPLGTNYNSVIHEAFTKLIQDAFKDSNNNKEVDPQSFVLLESVEDILMLKTNSRPYLCKSFSKGVLHQVSRESYGLNVSYFDSEREEEYYGVGYFKNSKNSNERKLIETKHTVIILKKGQPIADNEELIKTFYLDREHKDFAKVKRIQFGKYLGHY
jgi:hypothetical protein